MATPFHVVGQCEPECLKMYLGTCEPSKDSVLPTRPSNLGPVVQSVVSLTSSLRVISLTVLADSVYNILIFFAEKM